MYELPALSAAAQKEDDGHDTSQVASGHVDNSLHPVPSGGSAGLQELRPPEGSAETNGWVPPAAQNVEEGHDRLSSPMGAGTTVQAVLPPAGSVDTITCPALSVAAQNRVDGHANAVSLVAPSTSARRQVGCAATGSLDAVMPPAASAATQSVDAGHETATRAWLSMRFTVRHEIHSGWPASAHGTTNSNRRAATTAALTALAPLNSLLDPQDDARRCTT